MLWEARQAAGLAASARAAAASQRAADSRGTCITRRFYKTMVRQRKEKIMKVNDMDRGKTTGIGIVKWTGRGNENLQVVVLL